MSQKTEQSAYSKLSPKRQRFVDKYFECKFNGTRAAIEAGYSKNGADRQSEFLLRNIEIKSAVEERRQQIEEENKLKISEVVDELKKLAFSDITRAVSWRKGRIALKDSQSLPSDVKACIASITETPTKHGIKLSIKFHDKVKSLELLGRYLNMFTDKVQVESSGLGLVLHMNGKQDGTKD